MYSDSLLIDAFIKEAGLFDILLKELASTGRKALPVAKSLSRPLTGATKAPGGMDAVLSALQKSKAVVPQQAQYGWADMLGGPR